MEFSGEGMRSPKERGEWAEARFLAKATEQGFRVSKPWGESARYDFALERDGRFLRIQVKSTVSHFKNGYRCWIQPSQKVENPRHLYTAQQVDFFAAYAIPEDLWYIFPAAVVEEMRNSTYLFPRSPEHKYEKYKEAWELLRAAVHGKEGPAVEEDGGLGAHGSEDGEALDMRAEVEAPAVGLDQNLVRRRMAACFERMRR